jgi:muramoyltetrapeptide carboxypeptidase
VIIPPALPRGGTIGICAPAGPVDPERLRAAIRALEESGFVVVTSPNAFGRSGYLSASDEVRARELEDMFVRSDVDAVICARGGVGGSRLLETLDTRLIAEHPKPFLGFSDNTVLQWLLWARHRFVSFSGPMAVEWSGSVSSRTRQRALDLLGGTPFGDFLSGFPTEKVRTVKGKGTVSGTLMPGNLTMITTLLGTPYLPDLSGALLVIEDVNEPSYRVDRMLFHVRNAGVMQKIAGLLCGELNGHSNGSESDSIVTALLDATRGCDCPIMTGLPFDHGSERVTLPVGLSVTVNFDSPAIAPRQPVTLKTPA